MNYYIGYYFIDDYLNLKQVGYIGMQRINLNMYEVLIFLIMYMFIIKDVV